MFHNRVPFYAFILYTFIVYAFIVLRGLNPKNDHKPFFLLLLLFIVGLLNMGTIFLCVICFVLIANLLIIGLVLIDSSV